MFKLAVVGTVAAVASATNHPINADVVNQIKEKATSWVPFEAHENPLANLSVGEIFGLLGTKMGVQGENSHYLTPEVNGNIPAAYDARDTGCVHAIRDQGQ